jgi:chorismate synthase
MIRFLTAGESHGPALVAILEGMVAGLPVNVKELNLEMSRRKMGYGRGDRMKIEKDRVKVLSGLRFGKTLGSPIAMLVENLDWPNWQEIMNPETARAGVKAITFPRPGHADLAGLLKFGQDDVRNVLERASARETAMRVAVGAVCKQFLDHFDIRVLSLVTNIGSVTAEIKDLPFQSLKRIVEESVLRTADKKSEKLMMLTINAAKEEGDSLGGIFEVRAVGLPAGLGSFMHWDQRLDGALAQAVMSIPSVKAVEFGAGFDCADLAGSQFQDEIFKKGRKFLRKTNRAGGLEGGMTNGEPLIIRAAVKPIATIKKQLQSVDLKSGKKALSHFERADVCVVPAAGVVAESMTAIVLANAMLQKFGGDSLDETRRNFQGYLKSL